MESIGNRIRNLRKDKKLTQKDLAKILGITDAAIVHWEKDVNIPKLEHLNIMAPTLNTTIDYIMYGKSDTSDNVIDFRPITRMLPVLTYVQCGLMTYVRSISPHEFEKWLPAPPDTG